MSFRILGALAAETTDGVAVPLGQPKQRALLAILLLHVGEIVSTDRLVELLWGEAAPRTAPHSVQIYISELRRILEPLTGGSAIVTRAPGYLLQVPPDDIDARRFERMVAEGARFLADERPREGVALLREALRLWRGPALSDFTYEDFAQPYIRRLHDLHLDAIEELATAELAEGRPGEAVTLAEAAIQDDPLRERSRELLMLALYRSGRHPEALRTFEKLRQLLDEELGLEPSPPLQRLQERILLHEPSLEAAPSQREPIEVADRNPYKGLRAFTEADRNDFFGRASLVAGLVASLAAGSHFLALVGPSGAGKSSVVAAGLLSRLRDAWTIVSVTPDGNGLDALQGLATEANEGRLVVIDQFEELFTAQGEALQRRYLETLTSLVSTGQLTVLVSLRADLYDRPLLFPGFAQIFLAGVVNILPMSTEDLEAAVVRPAERAGVTIEPALVASLIADTVDQPGALPLLQYTLTELFDQRRGSRISLSEYQRLGGLRGILTRRAEELFGTLDADGQRTANQVFLRLVRPGRGTADSRRRLRLSELTALGLDPVALSTVLETYGRHRLLSFDREEGSAAATVEVAHEALLWEWERLARWIDRHRTALRRHESFMAALGEWEESGRDGSYLLSGGRLEEFAAWSRDGVILLTDAERAFLQASVEQRRGQAADEEARALAMRQLERRSRRRLLGLVGAVTVLAGGAVWAFLAIGSRPLTIGLLFHQAGTEIDRLVESGFDRAVSDGGLVAIERESDTGDAQAGLDALSELGPDAILSFTLNTDVGHTAAQHPEITYVSMDQGGEALENVLYLRFADEQGAFLAGVVAAMQTQTGRIGFIGGVDIPVIWRFQAGFQAGVAAIDPQVQVLTAYLAAPPDFDGFVRPDLAEAAAVDLFDQDVDVIFQAAGESGNGVFEAASTMSDVVGRHLWVIGVDTDQYQTVGGVRAREWQTHILTSMVKRIDHAVYDVVTDIAGGRFTPGTRVLDLESGAMEMAYTGGRIDAARATVERVQHAIVSGEISVPCVPADRAAQAAALGISSESCADSPG